MSNAEQPLDAARLTKIYRRIREAIEVHNAEARQKEQELKDQLQQVEKLLLAAMGPNDSIRNEHGSVRRIVKERFWSTDWDEMRKFALKHNALDLFENRIAQRNMAEFLKQHPTAIPAGLQVDRRYAVHVVKPRSKPE